MNTGCTIDGCEGVYYGRGWCTKHWTRWYRHGDPNYKTRRSPGERRPACQARGCERGARAFGYCDAHRRRVVRDGAPRHDVPIGWSRASKRQWPAVALLPEVGSYRALGRLLGVSERAADRWDRVFLTTARADEVAFSLGLMPEEVWPEWLEVASHA